MSASETQFARPPAPPSERGVWLLAGGLVLVGVTVLALALSGALGRSAHARPPQIVLAAATPVPAPAGARAPLATAPTGAAFVDAPSVTQQALDAHRFAAATRVHIPRRWMEGFYPIYATAQSTFGVNWLLLASIHMQESAFSTAAGIYHGLNFVHCCAGPMQFNVTNGPVTTWDLVSNSYRYGKRPSAYDHSTARHPSVYDDFDSMMAAAHLLSADGAGFGLEGAAWDAAYDYYGHDATGVTYADQVLARAIGWSQHGFCINCGVREKLVQVVHAAYGAPVLAALIEEERTQRAARAKRGASRRAARAKQRATRQGSARQPARR
jgi:hypothetical protein